MRVPEKPACGIDWRRYFSLPVGVPPESLGEAQRLEYVRTLEASAHIPTSSFDRFQSTELSWHDVRAAPIGAAVRVILPRISGNPAVSEITNIRTAAASVIATGAFAPKPPQSGTPSQVEAELQGALPRDDLAVRFTAIPIPFTGLDSIRFYFPHKASPGFSGTLGLSDDGAFLPDGSLPGALPTTLLRTGTDATGNVELGEIDRLILRAPVSGRFRFEPYYIYRWTTSGSVSTLEPIGPSSAGRLVVQQPRLKTREGDPADPTDTLLFQERLFAFEHVDRASVVPMIHASLAMQVRSLEAFEQHFEGAASTEPRLMIPKSSPELLTWIIVGVHNLLRSWLACLSVLRWRAADDAVATTIPADWEAKLLDGTASDAKKLIPVVRDIIGNAAQLESLLFFCASIYAPRLAGYTWTEVLLRNGQNPNVRRFPVTKDRPPFAPRSTNEAKRHEVLRLVEDPRNQWIACYAGCPVGKPAPLYAPTVAAGVDFPANGVTTYEVEALHAAGAAAAALGIAPPTGAPGPQAGLAMAMAPYAAKRVGYACFFSASRLGTNPLHTTVDFLLELTRGVHFRQNEAGFLDLHMLQDASTGAGHPLLRALAADTYLKASHLRRQMDELNATTLGTDSLSWWESVVEMAPTVALTPSDPYKEDRTRPKRFLGVLKFEELFNPPVGTNVPSGFDMFDLVSAFQACGRMSQTGTMPLPLPVLLALMETEGVKLFASINRHVRYSKAIGATLSWEALRRGVLAPTPRTKAEYPTDTPTEAHIAREAWLSYPYGLDEFAAPDTEAAANAVVTRLASSGVFTLDPDEDLIAYIRKRVWSEWLPLPTIGPDHGLPQIWKLTRRVHWAALSLMAGFYRKLELDMHAGRDGFSASGWPDPAWLPAGSSPPSLARADGSRVLSTDVEWKDYLTYYGMIYAAYNSNPTSLLAFITGVNAARPAGSALSPREFLLFKHSRGHEVMQRMVRFVIALDAYMRLNLMEGLTPADYANASADIAAPSARAWGV